MTNTHSRMIYRLAVLALIAAMAVAAQAQTYTKLFTFPETDRNNTGIFSQLMAQGRDGNFYSTIGNGGAHKAGSAYKMTPAGVFTTLYDFCAQPSCADGSFPVGGLTLAFDGNLYGTTSGGGAHGAGTVFRLTPAGQLITLWSFDNGASGGAPTFTLLQGQDKNLYGVANNQYAGHYGAIFKISLSGNMTPLHQFTATDGNGPNLPTQGTDGNFYGTTVYGGAHNYGVVYKMTPQGAITVLYNFAAGASDGAYPEGVLVQGSDGAFYGLTARGGPKNVGTIFKITASGTFTLLGSFAGYNTDGAIPYAGLIGGTDGNFYGATANGGTKNAGMLFDVTPAGVETKLYNFCDPTCDPGYYPEAALFQHTAGKFYGLTTGNSNGGGAFYSLDMGLKPFVSLLNWQGKVGATVEILGQGFTGVTQVSFNGTPATFNNSSDTYMTATVPAGATTGVVTVTTFTGSMKSNRKFLVTPQILAFDPPSGVVGTEVTITGMSLTQTKGVGFGNTKPAPFTVDSDTQVRATVPLGAKTGWIGIQTAGGIVTFGNFIVLPAVLDFTPDHGPVGTAVKIKGTSFKGTNKVTFGGVAATSYQVISDVEVDALVPAGAQTGPIAVTTPSGTGTSTKTFTVTP